MNSEQFTKLLSDSGATDTAFAKAAGIDKSTVWRWKTGRSPIDAKAAAGAFLAIAQHAHPEAIEEPASAYGSTRELQLERDKITLERRVMELEMQIERMKLDAEREAIRPAGFSPKAITGGKTHAPMPGFEDRPESASEKDVVEPADKKRKTK